MRLVGKLSSRGLSAEGVHEVIGHQQPSGTDEPLCTPFGMMAYISGLISKSTMVCILSCNYPGDKVLCVLLKLRSTEVGEENDDQDSPTPSWAEGFYAH